jgi:hypothetical protein
MRFAYVLSVAVLLSPCGTFPSVAWADEIEIDSDSFAAVADSPSTGEFGFAYNYGDRWSAEQAALDSCHPKDARVVCWVNNGFCALALGDDKSSWGTGYEYGDGASNTAAIDTAIAECKNRTTGVHIMICLSSDGQYIYKPKPPVAKSDVAKADKPRNDVPKTAEKPKSPSQPATSPR